MEQEKLTLDSPGKVPRLHQCLICGKWTMEKLMHQVEVQSQGIEYVIKLICPECFKAIIGEDKGNELE